MVKSREEINRDHYKARCLRLRRSARGSAVVPAKPSAVRKRLQRACSTTTHATLEKDGWQVFAARWCSTKVKNLARQLRAVCKTATAEQYQLRAACDKRLSIPISKFRPSVLNKVMEETESLNLPGAAVRDNVVCILARTGAKRQSDHVDTRLATAYSVCHVITQRYIHVGVGGELCKLNAGDVLVLRGGTCHAGAEHTLLKPSMLIHVPVGYHDTTTLPCK